MPVAKREKSDFTPCPEGLFHAVCVDVVDLGLETTPWGEKPKVRLVWQVDERDEEHDDRRFQVQKKYTLSLHEKSNLCRDLESWRGRKFTDEEAAGFELDVLVGVNCQVQVIHNLGENERVYANVQAVVPAPKGVTKLVAEDYTRHKDREKQQGNEPKEELTADDIPF